VFLDSFASGSRTDRELVGLERCVNHANRSVDGPNGNDQSDALDPVATLGSQGQVYIFWTEETPGCDILFSRSVDGGNSFSAR
jgi:hypothetical protein